MKGEADGARGAAVVAEAQRGTGFVAVAARRRLCFSNGWGTGVYYCSTRTPWPLAGESTLRFT